MKRDQTISFSGLRYFLFGAARCTCSATFGAWAAAAAPSRAAAGAGGGGGSGPGSGSIANLLARLQKASASFWLRVAPGSWLLIFHRKYSLRANSTFAPDSCPILLKFKKIKFVQLSTGKYFLPKIAQIF